MRKKAKKVLEFQFSFLLLNSYGTYLVMHSHLCNASLSIDSIIEANRILISLRGSGSMRDISEECCVAVNCLIS